MAGNTELITRDKSDSNCAIANETPEKEKVQIFYKNQCGC